MFFFFFNDTATTEIYTSIDTLSLHDALPISAMVRTAPHRPHPAGRVADTVGRDRKSTRLNSSHQSTSRMPSSARKKKKIRKEKLKVKVTGREKKKKKGDEK